MRKHCLVLALSFAACGPSQPAAEPTPEPGPAETPTPSPEPTEAAAADWSKMTNEQKTEFMQTKVMPHMGELFTAFDAKKFDDPKCQTCHGKGAMEGEFKMPNAELPKLSTTGKFEEEMKKKPDMTKFMMEKVTPEMAKLLNMEPYNPETKEGFGCFNCHQPKK
ncbi:MAG TPA: hypothetical protein VFB62_18190 [Polyangiaceae bacterium]|nr:hypothetical protein [Polyangiaceae bacterium]